MAYLVKKEIEQSSFTIEKLIENLTYKSTDGRIGDSNFDPLMLEEIFMKTIEDLKDMNESSKKKIEVLNAECLKEKLVCKDKFGDLEQSYNRSYDHLVELDKRINIVSTSMSEMSSQLENLNKPRLNLYESHKITKYFDKFMDGIENSGVFADDSKIEQAAEIIYKLHYLSIDLTDEKFQHANELIEAKYDEIQKQLIQRFHQAFFKGDKPLMKKCLNILINFKDYQSCVNEFIKNCQLSLQNSKDIFVDLIPLSSKTNEIINEIFINNERIMEQFVRDLFLGRVQAFINNEIEKYKDKDTEKHLSTLFLFYNKTKKIFNELHIMMKLPNESSYFTKLMNDLYQGYLKDYSSLESQNLHNKLKVQLERFFESISHTKRNLQSGFVSNLLAKTSNEVIDERFISNDVTTLCIDDAKKSITRTMLLCDFANQPKMVDTIYDIMCYYLCKEHMAYALDLQLNVLQSVDVKQEVNLHVFLLIKQLNNVIYLFEQFTNSCVLAAVKSTPMHAKIMKKFKQVCTELEIKVDAVLEKSFTVILNRIKHVLQIEQKKTDFKSETDSLSNQCTPACTKVLRIIESQIAKVNSCLDGKNINSALHELGIKFHRCIYDHLFRFEYSESGAMALIRDINEYRLCAKNFNSHIVDRLFVILYSLSNLLVVKPSNLQTICSGENLAILNKDIIESFVQLRSDFKTLKFQINRNK